MNSFSNIKISIAFYILFYPCKAVDLMPLIIKNSFISSTSLILSAKINTGGAVCCNTSRRYTNFYSYLTYSTFWTTFKLAAPALPIFIVTG